MRAVIDDTTSAARGHAPTMSESIAECLDFH
jgi:hypothetical protein